MRIGDAPQKHHLNLIKNVIVQNLECCGCYVDCAKYSNIIYFLHMEFSVETVFSAEIQAICLKLCGNCVFLQNFQIKELVKNAVFYAAIIQNISV